MTLNDEGVPEIARCHFCARIITGLELKAVFEGRRELPMCSCGGNRYRQSRPRGLEWLLPRVLKVILYVKLGWA